ncbi:hypothetical protein ACJX0J_011959 [Zea mays]
MPPGGLFRLRTVDCINSCLSAGHCSLYDKKEINKIAFFYIWMSESGQLKYLANFLEASIWTMAGAKHLARLVSGEIFFLGPDRNEAQFISGLLRKLYIEITIFNIRKNVISTAGFLINRQ